jgi:hypothetical protein
MIRQAMLPPAFLAVAAAGRSLGFAALRWPERGTWRWRGPVDIGTNRHALATVARVANTARGESLRSSRATAPQLTLRRRN